jgi:hypothetical protein
MDENEFRRFNEGANDSKMGAAVRCGQAITHGAAALLTRGEIGNDVASPVVVKTQVTGTVFP